MEEENPDLVHDEIEVQGFFNELNRSRLFKLFKLITNLIDCMRRFYEKISCRSKGMEKCYPPKLYNTK